MRVALASPFPPMSSGIADYAAALAPRLARRGLEVTLCFEGEKPPADPALAGFDALPARALAGAAERFDVVAYQLGNSAPHHATLYRTLLERPGVVTLHEFQLHHLVRELTLAAGDGAGYVEELRYAAGESGRRAGQRQLDTHFPVDPWSYPLFERVVDRSLAIVVHSEFARRRIAASRPRARVERIAFPVDAQARVPVDAERKRRARAELGLDTDAFVVGSFGFVTPQKRLGPTLAAFARLRARRPDARFLVCGEVSPHFDLASLLAAEGEAGVAVLGRLDGASFERAMAAVDVAVNLRFPTGGETSAAALDLLARGVPTVVSANGAFTEIADGAALQLPIGGVEVDLLEAFLVRAASDPGLLAAMAAAGRSFVEREHDAERSADAYVALLTAVALRPPAVETAVAPLAAWRAPDPRIALAASLGSDLADLGFDDGDPEALRVIADALAELDWAPRTPQGPRTPHLTSPAPR